MMKSIALLNEEVVWQNKIKGNIKDDKENFGMTRKKGFGINPVTNTIFYGTQDTKKPMWIGEKKDVTDEAIAVVYRWFMGKMEDAKGKKEEYRITYPDTEYELVMKRKKKNKCMDSQKRM